MIKNEIEKQLLSVLHLEFVGLKFTSNISEEEYHNDNFYIIGKDYENKIGIKVTSLEVFSLSVNDYIFINSSLSQLINFLKFFTQTIDFNENYVDEKRYKEIKEIKEEFRKIDCRALNEDCWWPYIIEQSKDGLL